MTKVNIIPDYITSIDLIDLLTGNKINNSGKSSITCNVFEERWITPTMKLILRIDWGDIKNGEPTLDADVYIKSKNGFEQYEFNKKVWHHTEIGSERVYTFNFLNNYQLKVKTIITAFSERGCFITGKL